MKDTLKIAALGDIHIGKPGHEDMAQLFAEISEKAEVLVLCGDLTDHGLEKEAEELAKQLGACRIPVVGVLGNHDLEGSVSEKIKKILKQANMVFLDEEAFILKDVGFVGTKGFGGGFDKHALSALHWEKATTLFVQEALNEALKLEESLGRLRTKHRVVALHYAPIQETIHGEPPELYPFLGSSRLVEPIDRFQTSLVFHGHSDYGKPEGKTRAGIPVYNVAYPLLQKVTPKQPYALITL